MEVLPKPASSKLKRNRKVKSSTSAVKAKQTTLDAIKSSPPMPIELKYPDPVTPLTKPLTKPKLSKKMKKGKQPDLKELSEKYPILQNQELVQKFLHVQMSNNQKGRIRQAIKDSLQGTNNLIVPDIVHNKIQSILKSSDDLTDSQLRRVRILYNLLKTALKGEKIADENAPKPVAKSPTDKPKKMKIDKAGDHLKDKKDQAAKKVKGPKRYVVFLGNLPLDIDKEKIINHFSEMNEHIKDIRIPKIKEGKKSAIAYVELTNEPSYEFALSKHHSMLGSRRINVLYTTQKNGKFVKGDAKGKSAKLIALQRSGRLVGSVPLAKKRSQRRLKLKNARARDENQM